MPAGKLGAGSPLLTVLLFVKASQISMFPPLSMMLNPVITPQLARGVPNTIAVALPVVPPPAALPDDAPVIVWPCVAYQSMVFGMRNTLA